MESDARKPAVARRRKGLYWAFLFIVAAATFWLFAQLRGMHSGAPDLRGSWEGFDTMGQSIVYHFDDDGTGYRLSDGRRLALRFEFAPGYPNRITIRFAGPDSSPPLEGLVRVVTNAQILLQLSRPGEDPPSQLDRRALDLRRPPTR